MDRWKAEMGRVREEKRKRKKIKEETVRRKMIPGARKGRKVTKHCVSPMICGRKVGSLKRWVRTQLARWEMNNCTQLWREAHFEVKMCKTANTPTSEHFWKLRCWKSARRCGSKHASKSKCTKHTMFVRTTFGSWHVEKVYAVAARSTFQNQKC